MSGSASLMVAMIPLPVSTKLRYRARLSNAGLFLLLSLLALSLLFNLAIYMPHHATVTDPLPHLLDAIKRHGTTENLTHLIIVPGHAIWTGTDPNLRLSEDQWLLESYQKGRGRLAAFFAHISRG